MPDALPEVSLKGFVSPLGIELINASRAGLVCEIYSFYKINTVSATAYTLFIRTCLVVYIICYIQMRISNT